mmetsp:Transcript_7357/g.18460  ORF Transcript_7357/g.18460 Transcript_7357/m.18460 type:complete len:202 (-) Transcript_7357:20-625(-)
MPRSERLVAHSTLRPRQLGMHRRLVGGSLLRRAIGALLGRVHRVLRRRRRVPAVLHCHLLAPHGSSHQPLRAAPRRLGRHRPRSSSLAAPLRHGGKKTAAVAAVRRAPHGAAAAGGSGSTTAPAVKVVTRRSAGGTGGASAALRRVAAGAGAATIELLPLGRRPTEAATAVVAAIGPVPVGGSDGSTRRPARRHIHLSGEG